MPNTTLSILKMRAQLEESLLLAYKFKKTLSPPLCGDCVESLADLLDVFIAQLELHLKLTVYMHNLPC